MASDPRVRVTRAFKAMKAIGISEIKVKPVLKKLLKLYEKNWELIEEENYRVLADAIFDEEDDAKGSGQTKSKIDEENFEDEAQEEPQPPLKRVRRGQEPQVPPSSSNSSPSLGGALLIRPKVEEDELPTTASQHQSQDNVNSPRFTAGNGRAEIQRLRNKGKEPVSVSALVASTENRCIPEISSHALSIREPAVEPENILLRKVSGTQELIRPKDEPFTDDMSIDNTDNRPQYEIPIAVIHPDKGDSSSGNVLLEEQVCQGSPASPHLDGEYRVDGVPASSSDRRSNNELTTIPEENPSSLEIASSPIGEERLGTVTPCHLLKKSTAQDDALLAPQCQLTSDELRAVNYGKDITKGEERVEIPWVNEIDAEHCCSDCFGNCLASASTIACACARQTGKFVYTPEGLLDEEFLAECVSMIRDPQQQRLLNCIDCPLEISKNEGILEPCKGHIERNIIKECWRKCGCYKQCGNRVVQRGINSKMQVFYTPEGKGWGIRTLEKLPKGAFVCEFVGEIVTIKELYDRNTKKHNCPVVLDAYWAPKKVSRKEEALCLDATCYGNVARFLNHRCFDANLIEIPVEIETPEHHYYHLAFFTTREVDALEELTWDYGIDFDDHDHLFKPFQCRCGSKFCRNMKRSSRSRSLATAR